MEAGFLTWLRERLGRANTAPCGDADSFTQGSQSWNLTDDAARLVAPDSVITTDMLLEGVHFLADADLRQVGRKALAANLSDLAAMAARPQGAVCSLALPASAPLASAQQLLEGMLPLLERYDMPLVGGDTNVWDGPIVVNLAVWGDATRGSLRRSGGCPGDRLIVTGPLGGSILGHHMNFEPRVFEALAMVQQFEVHAGMDITDGLSLDLSRLAAASGCGALIDLAAVPISNAARQCAETSGRTPLDHALNDGEDFELLLAVPADACRSLFKFASDSEELMHLALADVGELCDGSSLLARESDGSMVPLAIRGYEHGVPRK